jgi:uncharacterized protein YeaO (DUF488 family)
VKYGSGEICFRKFFVVLFMIKTKRAYDHYEASDGLRFLIDRLWPRGIKKDELKVESWLRDIAPSNELRKWFSHDRSKWEEFKKRYLQEIKDKPDYRKLIDIAKKKDITLVYSSKEEVYNNATALKEFIENELKESSV